MLALLRETGVLCVYGSGFGTPPDDGFFRVVFLASPAELGEIYDIMAAFTQEYLAVTDRGSGLGTRGSGQRWPRLRAPEGPGIQPTPNPG